MYSLTAADERTLAVALLLGLCGSGCRTHAEGDPLAVTRLSAVSAPALDASDACTDVGQFRACWSPKSGEGVWVGARPLPALIVRNAAEYRCTGSGKARRCRLRGDLASRFRCGGGRCVQDLPRLPDDGEWECADLSGAVLCRGGATPAGVVRPGSDPGWFCGTRRGAAAGDRLCLDLDPDYPSSQETGFQCWFEFTQAKLSRVCEPSALPRLGSRCGTEHDCPPETRCFSKVCLPPELTPDCWGNADCAGGRCAYGRCVAGAG